MLDPIIRRVPIAMGWLAVCAACGKPPVAAVNDSDEAPSFDRHPRRPVGESLDGAGVAGDGERRSLGLERCDLTAPLPPVRFENDYPTHRECKLAGEYDSDNFCTIARALANVGVTWTSPLVLTREQSSTLIVRLRGLGKQPGGITVNPRPSGEVMVDQNGELWSYCVEISASEIALSLWMVLSG